MATKTYYYASPDKSYIRQKSWQTQSSPWVKPLPFSGYGASKVYKDSRYVDTNAPRALGVVQGSEESWAYLGRAYARAYDRLVTKSKGEHTASVGSTIAERRDSFEMIAKRANQVHASYRQIRRGDVRGALRTWGFQRRVRKDKDNWVRLGKGGKQFTLPHRRVLLSEKSFKRGLRDSGTLWLEYWFGWAPLLNDVYAAAQVLSDKTPEHHFRNVFRGTGTEHWVYRRHKAWATGFEEDRFTAKFAMSAQATITPKSPNKDLANRLGVTNPALIAWEVVPFSWLVDWVIPVGRFLESYTDFIGVSVTNPIISSKSTCERFFTAADTVQRFTTDDKSTAFRHVRELRGTLPIPGIFDRRGTLISSWTRAATAISVLAGFLKRN